MTMLVLVMEVVVVVMAAKKENLSVVQVMIVCANQPVSLSAADAVNKAALSIGRDRRGLCLREADIWLLKRLTR